MQRLSSAGQGLAKALRGLVTHSSGDEVRSEVGQCFINLNGERL